MSTITARRISRRLQKGVAMGSENTGICIMYYEDSTLKRIKRSYN